MSLSAEFNAERNLSPAKEPVINWDDPACIKRLESMGKLEPVVKPIAILAAKNGVQVIYMSRISNGPFLPRAEKTISVIIREVSFKDKLPLDLR